MNPDETTLILAYANAIRHEVRSVGARDDQVEDPDGSALQTWTQFVAFCLAAAMNRLDLGFLPWQDDFNQFYTNEQRQYVEAWFQEVALMRGDLTQLSWVLDEALIAYIDEAVPETAEALQEATLSLPVAVMLFDEDEQNFDSHDEVEIDILGPLVDSVIASFGFDEAEVRALWSRARNFRPQ